MSVSVVMAGYSGTRFAVDGWCPAHARLLSYGEYRDGACWWCDPKRASSHLANGKTPNPVHSFSVEQVEAVLEDSRKFRRRTETEQKA